jgi:hypothetical protein
MTPKNQERHKEKWQRQSLLTSALEDGEWW